MIIINLFTSHNISLQVSEIKDFLHPYFSYGKTSLNNNIKRNSNQSLVGCLSEVKR